MSTEKQRSSQTIKKCLKVIQDFVGKKREIAKTISLSSPYFIKKGRVFTLPYIWSGLRGSVAALDAPWSSAGRQCLHPNVFCAKPCNRGEAQAIRFLKLSFTPALFEPNTNRQIKKEELVLFLTFGADYGARTRHLNLGKVALYQMS